MDQILATHLIDADKLRGDDFAGFYQARKSALVELVERAMKKSVSGQMTEAVAEADESLDDDDLPLAESTASLHSS